MRKAQELALSTIVVAVLVLLILLVIGIILTRQTGKFSTGLSGCEEKGGECQDSEQIKNCQLKAISYSCSDVDSKKRTCCLDKI